MYLNCRRLDLLAETVVLLIINIILKYTHNTYSVCLVSNTMSIEMSDLMMQCLIPRIHL